MSARAARIHQDTARGRLDLEETAFGMLADLEALDWPAGLDKETSAKLYEACAAEWKADMQSGFVRNVREASEPVEAESLPASRSLQSVSATLTAEEARWRSGGFALQQHWLQEAQSMFVRWRAEDSARLTAALRQAASATVSFEARLVALSLPHVLQSLHPLADDVERACAPEGGGRGVEVVAKWLRGAGTGYCRRANGGNCDSDDHGSIPLSVAETRTEWHAAAACLRKCRQCARCRHISVSVEFRECSWYSVW